MIYIGIDVAKDKHDCLITNSDGEILFPVFTISNNLIGFSFLLQRIQSCTTNLETIKIGLEATGHYGNNIADFLVNKNYHIFIINPLHTSLYKRSQSLRKTKTDKADAQSIVSILMTQKLTPYYIKTVISFVKEMTGFFITTVRIITLRSSRRMAPESMEKAKNTDPARFVGKIAVTEKGEACSLHGSARRCSRRPPEGQRGKMAD